MSNGAILERGVACPSFVIIEDWSHARFFDPLGFNVFVEKRGSIFTRLSYTVHIGAMIKKRETHEPNKS